MKATVVIELETHHLGEILMNEPELQLTDGTSTWPVTLTQFGYMGN